MRLIVTKGPSWTCELCHNRANAGSVTVCTICKAERPKHCFAITMVGSYYLCRMKSGSSGAVSVCEISTARFSCFSLTVEEGDGSVEDGIREALRKWVRVRAENAKRAEMIMQISVESDKYVDTMSAPPTNPPSTKPGALAKAGSFLNMFDPGLSLFETVMQNASEVVYDGKIGQYVDIKTVGDAAEDHAQVKKNLSYVEFMRNEQVVMARVVKEVVRRRADEMHLYDLNSDLDINRNEWDKMLECAMCERTYPKAQMPGQISFKAIADWKARHDAALPASDHRLDRNRIHDATRLCSFCTQFFDIHAVDLVDKQALKESVGVADIGLNGPLNCSNTVYKRLFRRAVSSYTDVEDRPLSKMRHRVALETLRFKAAMKSSSEARYLINPKFPNGMVDQEKVGKFLRTKYAQSAAGTLLLADKKSGKVTLQPLSTGTASSGVQTSAETTEFGEVVTAETAASSFSASSSAINSAKSVTKRSSSAHTTETKQKPRSTGIGRSASLSTEYPGKAKLKGAPHASSDSAMRTCSEALAQINKAYSQNLSATAPDSITSSPSKPKVVSFKGENEREDPESDAKIRKIRRRRVKESSGPEGVAKETRKPLILKVSAAAVVGSDAAGQVIEIELASSAKAPAAQERSGAAEREGEQGRAVAKPKKASLLSPLKGLLQNMQISKVESEGASDEQLMPSPTLRQNYILVDKSPPPAVTHTSPPAVAPKVQDSAQVSKAGGKMEHTPSAEPLKDHYPSHSGAHISPKKSVDTHQAASKPKNNTSKHKQSKSHHATSKQAAGWKHNVNKPVLRDVFDPAASSPQYRDHSYITQVATDDDFTIDEAYSEDTADPAAASDQESLGSIPDETRRAPLAARSDSFEQPDSYQEYEDDDFEDEDKVSPAALNDAVYEGESMDRYNWVSAGPYIPTEGGDGVGEDNGFSPVHFEASLGARGDSRMKMLSRGSAGGLFTPVSRGHTGARRYSGQLTPMLLSSAGGGFTADDGHGHRGGTFSPGKASSDRHRKTGKGRGPEKVVVVRKMQPATKAKVLGADGAGAGAKAAVRRREHV